MGSHLIKGLVLGATVLVGCANTTHAPTPAEKAALAPTGTLRVAVFTGNPVIGSKDRSSGELKGTTVSLGRELAKRASIPVTLIEYPAIAKMVEDAKSNVWDIAVVAFDPGRRNVLDFAPPHIAVDLTYLVPPYSSFKSVAEVDAAGVKIAAARGAATALYLERNLKNASVTAADNEPAAFQLIKDGQAQAYAQNRYMLLGLAENLPGARVLDDRFSLAEMCIVLPKGRPEALAFVSAFVQESRKSGVIAQAISDARLRGVTVAQ